MEKNNSVDEYLAGFSDDVQEILELVRLSIAEVVPSATEVMSYGIPTFDLNGKHLVHFAGYEHHIGFYPGSEAIEMFQGELKHYKTSKGTIQFPIEKPMPIELIQKITKYRLDNI